MILSISEAPLIPLYCGRCDMPVERIKYDRRLNPWYWAVQVQCCGSTRGMRIPVEDMLRVQTTGEKVYAITRKGHRQTIKHQARLEAPVVKPISIWMPR